MADWLVGQTKQRDDLSVDVIDLADIPILSANFASWIGAVDAFVVVTPEYNHGYPGPLKTRSTRWAGTVAKPVGFVSYGGLSGGSARSSNVASSSLRHLMPTLPESPQ